MAKSNILPERVNVGLTREDARYLDDMMHDGGFKSRAELVRSLLRVIIDDDKAAHKVVA